MTDHNDFDLRVALRGLVEEYARTVDAGDSAGVARLFTEDGRLLSHLQRGTEVDPLVRAGHEELRAALAAGLAYYEATTHMIGGQVLELEGETAHGTTRCMAHHVYEPRRGAGETGEPGRRRFLVMSIRYEDAYVRRGGLWRFAERRLRLDWSEDRAFEEKR